MGLQLFLDESGGWVGKNRRSPHSHFTLAVILIETDEIGAACTEAIAQARTMNGLDEKFEFHFAEITHAQRMAFFSATSKCPFCYAATTIDNNKTKGKAWKDKAYYYERAIVPLVESFGTYLQVAQAGLGKALSAKLTYDECHDPVFRKTLESQFRMVKDPKGRSLVDKIRPGTSRTSDLIQLADMVCGAAAQFFEGTTIYRDLIQQKEEKHHWIL